MKVLRSAGGEVFAALVLLLAAGVIFGPVVGSLIWITHHGVDVVSVLVLVVAVSVPAIVAYLGSGGGRGV